MATAILNLPSQSTYLAAKRALDLAIAVPALILSAAVELFSLAGARPRTAADADGENGSTHDGSRLSGMRLAWALLRGDISLVGPRLASVNEFGRIDLQSRNSVKPGLVCLHWLRARTNVAYRSELENDMEYISNRGLQFDLSILASSLLALVYGKSTAQASNAVRMLGVRIDNITLKDALDRIADAVSGPVRGASFSFVNADCLNKASGDSSYRKALAASTMVLADGIGVKMAGTVLGSPVRENVNGTDMFPRLCAMLQQVNGSMYLLGARPEVVKAAADRVRADYPGIRIVGVQDGYFKEEEAVVEAIAAAQPDVLIVAMGAPVQELFIARNSDRLGAKVSIGVGGLLDFISGRIPRAPQWMRDAGLEWTYRLYQEPGRMWKRYLVGNGVFLTRVLYQKLFIRGTRRREAVTA